MKQNNPAVTDADEEISATPEEEQQLQQAIDAAMKMIHAEGQTGDNIAAMVLQSQDIATGIGQATATIVIGVEKQSQLAEDVKLALAEEVVNELVALAIEAGALAEDEVTDDFVDQAVSHAYSQYLQVKDSMGELDQQHLASSVEEAKAVYGQQKGQARGKGLMQQMQRGL
jgi:arginine/ornithine N-succinyltransferase beta subunit